MINRGLDDLLRQLVMNDIVLLMHYELMTLSLQALGC